MTKEQIEDEVIKLANRIARINKKHGDLGENLTGAAICCLKEVKFFLEYNQVDTAARWLEYAKESMVM